MPCSRAIARAHFWTAAAPGRRARDRARRAASCALLLFRRLEAAFQVDEKERDRSRCDSGDSRRLPDRFRAVAVELLLYFVRQAFHRAVVEVGRQPHFLLALPPRDFGPLALDVTLIFRANLDLLRNFGSDGLIALYVCVRALGPPQKVEFRGCFREACAHIRMF